MSDAAVKDKPQSEAEMMEACLKLAQPGMEHEALARTTGNWIVEMQTWMAPGEPPQSSTGTARFATLHDGRIRTEEFAADFAGFPFRGFGLMGFENSRQEYWMTWTDNMSTGLFVARGPKRADGKLIELRGTMDRPTTGEQAIPTRIVYRQLDDDHFVFEYYDYAGTPRETKSMENHYRRS